MISMIEDRIFFAESLMIPSSYRTIFKKINKNISQKNYPAICNSYKEKLSESHCEDIPKVRN